MRLSGRRAIACSDLSSWAEVRMHDNLTIFAVVFGHSAAFLGTFHLGNGSSAMYFNTQSPRRISGASEKCEKERREREMRGRKRRRRGRRKGGGGSGRGQLCRVVTFLRHSERPYYLFGGRTVFPEVVSFLFFSPRLRTRDDHRR